MSNEELLKVNIRAIRPVKQIEKEIDKLKEELQQAKKIEVEKKLKKKREKFVIDQDCYISMSTKKNGYTTFKGIIFTASKGNTFEVEITHKVLKNGSIEEIEKKVIKRSIKNIFDNKELKD